MIQVNIWEQITTFFNIFITNKNIITLSIISLASLFILLLANKFKNKKITKIICFIVYLGIFGTLFYFFNSEILKLLDYLMDNIFLFLFFPNLAVYILVLVVINIIIVRSTFSKNENKSIKNVNIIFFVIFNIIFYLIIDNVIKNKINVYQQLDIYTNNDLLILIELSMKLFLVWLCILLIIKISSNLLFYISLKKATNQNLILEDVIEEKELQDIKPIPEFDEINPIYPLEEVEETPKTNIEDISRNIYNDYIDIVPIKKNTLKIEIEEANEIFEEEKNKYQGISFENINVINNDNSNNYSDENINEENTIDSNLEVVFNNSNDYLKNIIFDIEKLKNNYNDTNQIKKIYENISMNQKELTLRDYNYLIDMLVNIKK